MSQGIESILQIRYFHNVKSCEKEFPEEYEMEEEIDFKNIKQSIVLRSISYKLLHDCKCMSEKEKRQVKTKD